MKQDTNQAGKKPAIIATTDGNTRVVTPTDPLYISQSSVTYDSVDIQGGEIYTQVPTTVTFVVLTKTS